MRSGASGERRLGYRLTARSVHLYTVSRGRLQKRRATLAKRTYIPGEDFHSRGTANLVRRGVLGGVSVAFAISIFLHIGGVLLSVLITVGGGSGADSAEVGVQRVEMALMTESEMLAVIADSGADSTPLVEDVGRASESDMRVRELESSTVGGGDGSAPSEFGDIGGGGDIATGADELGGGAGSGGARFFGVEAAGSRFVYVVDVSGSMEGPRLERLRTELTSSISELQEGARFLVVPFSTVAAPLGKRSTWTEASAGGKRWVKNAIATELAQARDGTVPLPGFQIAFSQRPRADAIYFMTDGEQFPPGTEEELAILNKQFKVPIHCIRFGDGDIERPDGNPAEGSMRLIAKQSKGTYKFISIK